MPATQLTEDPVVLRQVLRLRGLTVLVPTLTEYKDDVEVQILVCMRVFLVLLRP